MHKDGVTLLEGTGIASIQLCDSPGLLIGRYSTYSIIERFGRYILYFT